MNNLDTYINQISYKNHRIDILRLDILHPDIQGNKYYKLKYNIEEAKNENKKILLSFGGEYSNHIHALSLAGKSNNFDTIGIIRAEKPERLNATLSDASKNGMKLFYTNRSNFRDLRKLIKNNETDELFKLIKEIVPGFKKNETYIIPEGGTNALALKGTQEILGNIKDSYQNICVSVGTAGTIAGLIASKEISSQLVGFPALKGNFFENDINQLLKMISNKEYSNWELNHNYHFGGFATFNNELINFINKFYTEYNIPLDVLYTGKMFFGIFDMIDKDLFKEGEKILAIHTGGLQGNIGFNEKNEDRLKF